MHESTSVLSASRYCYCLAYACECVRPPHDVSWPKARSSGFLPFPSQPGNGFGVNVTYRGNDDACARHRTSCITHARGDGDGGGGGGDVFGSQETAARPRDIGKSTRYRSPVCVVRSSVRHLIAVRVVFFLFSTPSRCYLVSKLFVVCFFSYIYL